MNDNDKTKTELVMENVHLRRKLAEAEARIGRMDKRYKEQLVYDEEVRIALVKKSAELERCNERIEELEERPTLTDKERRILGMWPRFEDTGEPVWFGDELDFGGDVQAVKELRIMESGCAIADEFDYEEHFEHGQRVKRPVPEVLDADGVLIRVGDTVYGIGRTGHEFRVLNLHDVDEELGDAFSVKCYDMDDDEKCHCRPELLTHREPDSMLRLYEDTCTGKVGMNEFADRAKALSGVER